MAEHTNVFLPRQPLLHRSRLFICYCTQGYDQLLVCEQVHLICRLCNPALSLCPLVTEGFLLAVMAYDHFIAICNPCLYSIQMSTCLGVQLVAGSYICGCISSVIETSMTFTLSVCASWTIEHFYCDDRPLQRLSCSNIFIHKLASFCLSGIIILPTIIVIIVSYLYILSTVLKIPSTKGRQKAFSTCSSHLGVVSVLYVAVSCMYLTPDTSPELSKVASLCYTLLTPMLNPLIYSLRNKDVKEALRKILGENIFLFISV